MGNVIYVYEKKKGTKDRSLGNSASDRETRWCLGIKVNVLGSVGQVTFNPFISGTSYTINIEFVK